MVNADDLRQVAAEIRDKANAANTDEARRPYGDREIPPVPVDKWGSLVNEYLGGEIGSHCAAWHPAVALAVADWLDACASFMAEFPDYTHDGEDYAEGVVKAWRGES